MDEFLSREEGFSLLEILISAVLLVIIAVGVGKLLFNSFSALQTNEQRMNQLSQHQGTAEELMWRTETETDPIGMGDTLDFEFAGQGNDNLEPVQIEVAGGIREVGRNISVFLPAVPTVERFQVNPTEHVQGDRPEVITIEIETSKVSDGTPVAIQLVGNEEVGTVADVQGTIQDNEATLNLEVDANISPGVYNIGLQLDDLTGDMIATRDYLVRPIRSMVVGDETTILTSYQGKDWSQRRNVTPGITTNFNDATWGGIEGNKQFVVVGDNGVIMTSREGVDWETVVPTSSSRIDLVNFDFREVIWVGSEENKRFLAVGSRGAIVAGQYNETLDQYEWDWKRAEINAEIEEIELKEIDLEGAAYGGPTDEERIILVSNTNHTLVYKQDTGWQNRKFGNIDWYSVAWANILPDGVPENKRRRCFFLAGENNIRRLRVDDKTKQLTIVGSGYSTPGLEQSFQDILVGSESCYFAGQNLDDKEPLFYTYRYNGDEWEWVSLSTIPIEEETMRQFAGVSANDEQLFVVGNNNQDEPQILKLTTERSWEPVDLESMDIGEIEFREIISVSEFTD